ncbi:hypothetical protein SKAU_G00025910 [Synaphobranchus kaupii]|uniref:Reverse transcriptase n=1 Tax=Synaphobranchus kaupii TaxID=118154 RepID=A0A9Q1GDY1_SYNKA|nr:hypothetical protein SKAU_G00025910 [Synaphobranchus kaupii]
MLFIDFSSAFNTIIPQHLTAKRTQLGLSTSLCNWVLDFLTGRPQPAWHSARACRWRIPLGQVIEGKYLPTYMLEGFRTMGEKPDAGS